MSLWQRFESWRANRRSRLALLRGIESESALVNEIRRLEALALEDERRHANELREMQTEMMREREAYEHKLERLERQNELAKMENQLLTGIHSRDVARLAAECAVHERIASGQHERQEAIEFAMARPSK